MRDVGKLLLIAGAVLLVAGVVFTAFPRLGLGRLPGDIMVRRGNFTFYFPLMTSVILSIVLTVILWIFRR